MKVLNLVLAIVVLALISQVADSFINKLLQRRRRQSKNLNNNERNVLSDNKVYSRVPETVRSTRCSDFSNFLQRKNRWGGRFFGPVIRYISIFIVGVLFSFITNVMNRTTSFRKEVLLSHVFRREKGKGLLTYSNHQSMADDPGIWAHLLPFWRMHPEQFRWALCTEDVFFASRAVTAVMGAGNVIPLDRAGSIDQPLLERFHEKLREGKWCHIFPEGRVWQNWRYSKNEPILGKFKAGIGKVIAHSYPNDPIVLPVFHTGFDGIIPETILPPSEIQNPSKPKSPIPQSGNNLRIFVGQPISFHNKLRAFHERYPHELSSWKSTLIKIQLYREITEELRQKLLELEKEAYPRDSLISPPKQLHWPPGQQL